MSTELDHTDANGNYSTDVVPRETYNFNEICTECGGHGQDHPASVRSRNTDNDDCPKCNGKGYHPIPADQQPKTFQEALRYWCTHDDTPLFLLMARNAGRTHAKRINERMLAAIADPPPTK